MKKYPSQNRGGQHCKKWAGVGTPTGGYGRRRVVLFGPGVLHTAHTRGQTQCMGGPVGTKPGESKNITLRKTIKFIMVCGGVLRYLGGFCCTVWVVGCCHGCHAGARAQPHFLGQGRGKYNPVACACLWPKNPGIGEIPHHICRIRQLLGNSPFFSFEIP